MAVPRLLALKTCLLLAVSLAILLNPSNAFQSSARVPTGNRRIRTHLNIFKTEENAVEGEATIQEQNSAEETTEKYGLEAGVFQAVKSGDGESAKSLLAKYGVAYLATSIPLAIVSFAICYTLVDNGVDVGSLLSKVGIEASGTSETAGTFAIAYAAHKAASPIRFPPTVLLTPVVAKLIGKEPDEDVEVE
ncbi:hypothetical protein THAOC_37491 [Thalassiosira oceanica]|uniref:DUF1279 domain-containing protein n=1 Tax=Thalassiosira oceanica TaxID=159749 RepID=K0R5W8_THAOC|nr:hypothetical protein THAOC_37491 [Thalassiosira oceanica]|mmetsp:Transcript_35728/g.80270  ORF Transcript_35728/g.80270 Transcript_35728/m.80270 type:complete len:191 (+) Transcript_35728:85-657(+)|eukprot:EJK44011.1 hypothetical protein THAOC_37491 [Thalassiosira oceanica]